MALTLEFLSHGATDTPLVLLWGTDASGFDRVRRALLSIAQQESTSVPLHALRVVRPLGEVRVVARSAPRDRRLTVAVAPSTLFWDLRPESWEDVVGLLEPFGSGVARGFQDLERAGDIAFVVSATRGW